MHKRYVAILLSCMAVCATSGCDEGISALVGGVCSLGETACENGKLKVCALTSWQTTDCPDGCDDAGKVCRIPDGKECAVDTCDAGANNILKRCVDGVYKPEPCPTDKPVCQGMACVAEKCEVGKVKCSGDLSATVTCSVTGEWGEPVKCDDGKVCDVAKKSCESKENATVCENDAMKCKQEGDKSYYVCKDGQWSTEAKSCDGDKVCKGADGKAECKENTTEPDPSKCTAGAKMCDGTNIKTCKEDGTWGTPEPCEQAGYVCDANKNACVDASDQSECTNEKLKCEDSDITPNQYKLCVDGKWNTKIDKCPNDKPVCTADGCQPVGQDMCKNGAKKCKDMGNLAVLPKAYHTCVGGKWSEEPMLCPNDGTCYGPAGGAYCDLVHTADCKEGSIKCLGSEYPKSYQVCKKDDKNQTYWDPEVLTCPTLCLNIQSSGGQKESQCVECDPRMKSTCINENVLKSCSHMGSFLEESCASKNEICLEKDYGAMCVACKENDKRCNSTQGPQAKSVVEVCNASNKWVEYQDCTRENKSCDPNTLQCENKCKNGEGRCNADGSFDLCVAGVWKNMAQCGKNNCSDKGVMGCKCNDGETKCDADNDKILLCEKHEVMNGVGPKVQYMTLNERESCGKGICATTTEGELSEAFCKCDHGEYRCINQTLQYCQVNQWMRFKECSKNATCDATLGTCNEQCKRASIDQSDKACSGWDIMHCPASNSASFLGKYEVRKQCTDGCMIMASKGGLSIVTCIENISDLPILGGIMQITSRCSADGSSIEQKTKDGWTAGKTCNNGTRCQWVENGKVGGVYEPKCVVALCSDGEIGCSKDAKTVMACYNNQWDEVGKCSDNAQCKEGKCISMIKK